MIPFIIALVLIVVWLRHRAVKRRTLAGLNGERPVFSVEPPTRRLGTRKGERL